jgi:uncharacterized protein GlcG (DUF336 family)
MRSTSLLVIASLLLASCGGGGGGGTPSPSPTPPPTGTPPPAPPPLGGLFQAPAQEALSSAEVQRIIAQAVAEAQAQSLPVTIAVVDRVGNVLAVFGMNGADETLSIPEVPGQEFDFQGLRLPAPAARLGAIAKAITGAYLSSSGNAFTTRTASQIVQEHFPPSRVAVGLESGPLFGVQFSQLPCSDLNTRFNGIPGASAMLGPKRSPLGLSADAGGLPLYKNGVVVGGVGIMGDGVYGSDPEIQDVDNDREEIIAVAATQGFAAPETIRAHRITVDGTTLRYADADERALRSNPASAPGFASINGSVGRLRDTPAYFIASDGVLAGTAYGSEASGYRAATNAEFTNPDAFILTNGLGMSRFPIRGGLDGAHVAQPLTATETRVILEEAFLILSRARGQIRQPLDSRMQATISVVDSVGNVLGIVRSPDAPIFGTDVSLQKARTAAFFSSARAGALLEATPSADVRMFAGALRTQTNDPQILNGKFAITARAIGNVARPYFPDGEVGRPHGALSRPITSFSPFSTGLQSALILPNVLQHASAFFDLVNGTGPVVDTFPRCTQVPEISPGLQPLANGIQIFPGSVPIYRGGTLIGAVGVSGDGIDQDDMVSFLGLANAGVRAGTIGHADPAIRSDRIEVPVGNTRVRLRYVNCPFAPFVGSSEQNVCQGI